MKIEKKVRKPVILAISGFKNSGKTTLISRLISRLSELGYRVATIKHDGHDFEADREGSDTHCHLNAGAVGTAIFSENKYMIVNQIGISESQLFQAFDYADIILLEGFKYSNYPKIELVKKGEKPVGTHLLAVVLEEQDDIEFIEMQEMNRVKAFARDDIDGILEVVLSVMEC